MPDVVPGTLTEALAQLQGRLPRVAKEHTAKVETKTGGNYNASAKGRLRNKRYEEKHPERRVRWEPARNAGHARRGDV